MRRLPPPLQVLVLAIAAVVVTLPLAGIQWRQDMDEEARLGGLCLLVGLAVLWAGTQALAIRRVFAAESRRDLTAGAWVSAVLVVANVALLRILFVEEAKYPGPWTQQDLAVGFGLAKVLVLVTGIIGLVALAKLVLMLAGAWRGTETHRAQVGRALAVKGVTPALLALLLIAVASFPFFMGRWPLFLARSDINLALETLIYMTLALGLNVVVGYAGLLVLGYAAFWAIGAYTFALLALRLDVSIWLAFPIAGATSMLAGFLIGLPSLRLRGDYLAIVTLGFGEVVYYLLKTEVPITGGEMGLPNMDIKGDLQEHAVFFGKTLQEPVHYYWPALALVVLAIFVMYRLERSRVGRALVAMREDETAAKCMGINTTRLKLTTFAFAAMWAGLAGVLWCAKSNYTNPMFFNFLQSVMILAMVVLGGLGSIPGAIVGTILLYAGPALMRDWFPDFQTFRLLIFGGLMVLLMIYRPQGLFGSARLKAQLEVAKEDA